MDKSYDALLHASIIFVRAGSIVGLLAGIGLLVRPGQWGCSTGCFPAVLVWEESPGS